MKKHKEWPLQDAKAKLSELVKISKKGPQYISVRGKSKAVVLSIEEYRKLVKPLPDLLRYDS